MTDTIDQTAMQNAAQGEQSIALIVEHRPEIVLIDTEKRDALFAHIEQEIAAFVPDVTTAKGRDAIKALAFKVTKTKTAIDKARLQLTDDARAKIKSVNAEGSAVETRLKEMADKVRAPLTAWEAAEEKRQAECKAALERFRAAAIVPLDATADSLRTRITEVDAESMAQDHWQAMMELAETAKATALASLTAALAIVEQKEKDAAELAALREEREARAIADEERRLREEAEAEAAAAREAAAREATEAEQRRVERERLDAEEAEIRRAASEEERAAAEEQARIAQEEAAAAAAETARQEEQARAAQQAAEAQAAHEAELEAANERARIAEVAAAAERDRLAEIERQRVAAEQAAAEERARLEASQERRTQAKREAKEAIMSVDGVTEAQAKAIVLLIISGEVPRTFLDFAAEPKVKADPTPKTEERLI